MKVVSLFAGCGGLDLGFERAGFEVIWANEYDKTIHDTYRLNHPKTILSTADIRTLSSSDIPDCDGIIGGPPCQSWSLGGKSLGIEDERGQLVYDYIRLVKNKQPKFFIMENVPGMVSPKHIAVFKQFLQLFQDAGYSIKYELLKAAEFKIPQERLRVFIVGIRNDLDVEYFFPSKTCDKYITLKQAIGDLPSQPRPYNTENVLGQNDDIPNHDYYSGPFDRKYMARNRIRGWSELSFTIQAQARNAPLHPQAPKMVYISPDRRIFAKGSEQLYRRLSVRECARIQTFPDGFKFLYANIEDGYKMVGNAVPPRLAYHLALSIKKCFDSLTPSTTQSCLALVGYVRSNADFEIIIREKVYYVRGGNRAGGMQFGQLFKPVKWLLLHRNGRKEIFELNSQQPSACNKEDLTRIGFKPRGNDYWLFSIEKKVDNSRVMASILDKVKQLKMCPQIVVLNQ